MTIELSEPTFSSGEVPKAKAAIERLLPKIKKCVDEHGGLTEKSGKLTLSFLVRASGTAEGIDVKSRVVGVEAQACVAKLLKKKTIGTPSEDPIGVSFTLSLSPEVAASSADK